jgi:hypothetical protein
VTGADNFDPHDYFRIELCKDPVPHAKASFRFRQGSFEIVHEFDLNDREYTVFSELSRQIVNRYIMSTKRTRGEKPR